MGTVLEEFVVLLMVVVALFIRAPIIFRHALVEVISFLSQHSGNQE